MSSMEEIAQGFVQFYYGLFDGGQASMGELKGLYVSSVCARCS